MSPDELKSQLAEALKEANRMDLANSVRESLSKDG